MKIKTLSFIKKTKESTNLLGKILMELPTTVAIFSELFLLSKILIGESRGVKKMKDAVN